MGIDRVKVKSDVVTVFEHADALISFGKLQSCGRFIKLNLALEWGSLLFQSALRSGSKLPMISPSPTA